MSVMPGNNSVIFIYHYWKIQQPFDKSFFFLSQVSYELSISL